MFHSFVSRNFNNNWTLYVKLHDRAILEWRTSIGFKMFVR